MAIPLITKGILYSVPEEHKFLLPFNMKLRVNSQKMTVKKKTSLKLNIKKICG